jgi:hypothetical protein
MKKILKKPAFDFFNKIIITRLPISILICIWSVAMIFSLKRIQEEYVFDSFNWRYIHWLFNYDIGFVKRGLVGQLLVSLKIPNDYFSVSLIAFIIFIIFFIFIVYLASQQILINKKSEGAWLFFCAMTLSSATLQHAFLDLLRFDYVNYLFFIVYLFVVDRVSKMAAYVVLYVIMSIMLLIHEAAFLMFFPVMLAVLIVRKNKIIFFSKELYCVIILILIFQCYEISSKALLPIGEWSFFMRQILDKVVGISDFDLNDGLMVVFRPLADNVGYAASHVEFLHSFVFHIVFFLINIPLFFIIFIFLVDQYRAARLGSQEAFYRLIGFLACFSPLTLYPIGYDYFRWWSISITNLFIYLAILAKSVDFSGYLQKTLESHRAVVLWGIIGFSLWYGPVRVIASYDAAFEPLLLLRYFFKTLTNQPDF